MAESIIGLFKTELIRHHSPWRSLDTVELATMEWVDWYNNRRLFEAIGDIPPAEAETNHYRTTMPPETFRWQKPASTEAGTVPEAADDKRLSRVLGRYARLDLLCLDEIGYLTLDPRGAELLFQVITAREERLHRLRLQRPPSPNGATPSPTRDWPPQWWTG